MAPSLEDLQYALVLQALLTLFLIGLFWALHGRLDPRRFSLWWTLAWVAFFGYLAAGAGAVAVSAAAGPPDLGFALAAASTLCGFLQPPLMAFGARALIDPDSPRAGVRRLALAATLAAAALAVAASAPLHWQQPLVAPFVRAVPRQLLLAAALSYCAACFLRYRRATGSRAALVAAVVCALWAVDQLLYAAAGGGRLLAALSGATLPLFDAFGPLHPRLTVIDLAWQLGIAYGTVGLLLEEHARIEAAHHDSEQRFRTTFEQAAVGIAHVRPDGRWLRVNQKLCDIVGYTHEELLGLTFQDITYPEDLDADLAFVRRVAAGELTSYSMRKRYVRRDGSLVWINLTVAPVRAASGELDYFVSVVEDIDELVRAERERERLLAGEQAARREAEHASHLKDEFLAVVSHELRTPLTSILGRAQWLLRKAGGEGALAGGLREIEHNARAQVQLVNDLLDVTRIIRGQLPLDPRPLDLGQIVADAADAVRAVAEAKGVALDVAAAEAGLRVAGDAGRLRQVVWNLLANAVKFTPEGGRVEVRLGRTGDDAEVVVRDTGRGISPAFLPHVFDRFRQADGSETREHRGLGLGLAISRELVDLHGGTITAESEGEGRGATFTVRLPLAQAGAGSPP